MKWNREQTKCLDLINTYGIEMFPVKYEQLIQSPQKVMTEILKFLNLPIEERCFQTDNQNKESAKNEFWKNLSKPIITDNTKKYLKHLTNEDLQIVESIAKKNMRELDYNDFVTKADWVKKKNFISSTKLVLKRNIIKRKFKDFIQKDMELLESKRELIKLIKDDIIKNN